MKKIISVILCLLILASLSVFKTSATTKVKLNKTKLNLKIGKTFKLKLKGAKGKIKWKSSKKTIAVVNSKGKVTAKKAGTSNITATYKGKSYKCTVKVAKMLTKQIYLNKSKITVKKGKSYTLKCSLKPKNVSTNKIKWTSSNTKVATVSSKGKITAKKSGISKITVKTMDGTNLSATCEVKVVNVSISSTLKQNLVYLKNYIQSYGEYNNAGYKAIYGSRGDCTFAISYITGEKCFNFYWGYNYTDDFTTGFIAMKLSDTGFDYCTAEMVDIFEKDNYMDSYSTDIIIKTATYNIESTIPTYKITSNTTGMKSSEVIEDANIKFQTAMYDWNYLLISEAGSSFNDIGFKKMN